MQKKTIIAAGLALAMTAGAAFAQSTPGGGANPPPPRHGPGGPGGPGEGWGRGGGDDEGRGGFGRHGGRHHPPYATKEELEKRRADTFARMDGNHDGKVTFEEFRAEIERRKVEREHRMFMRFSGGQDSVTLDQLKAREAQRFEGRRHGPDGRDGGRGGAGPAR